MSAGSHDELEIVEIYWQQLRAVDQRLWRRARARAQRRRVARTLAIAVLALLLAAAVAVAAKVLLFGADAPPTFPSQSSVIGPIAPGETRLLSPHQDDADGGPSWGVRVLRTAQDDRVCMQVGRVVNGRLAAIGVAGAFGNDGRAHALALEGEACAGVGAGVTEKGAVLPLLVRSGLLSGQRVGDDQGCLGPDARRAVEGGVADAQRYIDRARARGDDAAAAEGARRLEQARERLRAAPPACAVEDLRTAVVGFAGPNAASVTLTGSDGVKREQDVLSAEEGAFLFVLSGQELHPGTLTVSYRDGTTCVRQDLLEPGAAPPTPDCVRARNG